MGSASRTGWSTAVDSARTGPCPTPLPDLTTPTKISGTCHAASSSLWVGYSLLMNPHQQCATHWTLVWDMGNSFVYFQCCTRNLLSAWKKMEDWRVVNDYVHDPHLSVNRDLPASAQKFWNDDGTWRWNMSVRCPPGKNASSNKVCATVSKHVSDFYEFILQDLWQISRTDE